MSIFDVDGLQPREIWGFLKGRWFHVITTDVMHEAEDMLETARCGYPVLVCDPMFNPNAGL